MKTQYHLKGRGFSGRAVRVEPLDPAVVEGNLLAAAKLAGPEATGLEVKKTEWRNGLKLSILAISDSTTAPTAAETKWKKPSHEDLDDLGKFFTAKDIQALEQIYREYHEVMPAELAAITGEAIDLSEG